MNQIVAFSILAATVSLALGRPHIGRWRLQPAAAAVAGACLTVALGIVPPALALETLRALALPLVTIASLMAIMLVAEQSGLLALLAYHTARLARGDARKLFTYLFACGALTGTVFTNDAAVLIFTPLVFTLVEEVQTREWTLANKIPFYFSVLYIGNLVGALVISNPINIIVASFFDIPFADYASWMVLPALVSMVVSYIGLRIYFRRAIPVAYRVPEAWQRPPTDGSLLKPCTIVLAVTLLGFFTEGATGIPTWLVALASAIVLVSLHLLHGHSPVPILRGIGWDVLLFVAGIFIVVLGFRSAGFAALLADALRHLAGNGLTALVTVIAFAAALLSSLFNNHPTAGLMIFIIDDLALPALETRMLVFAALIGGDLGPKMLPIGSLAALMWFRMLRARGVHIPYGLYVRIGVPVTLAAVSLSLAVLVLQWLTGIWPGA